MKSLISIMMLLALPAIGGREFVTASSQLGVCTIDPLSPPLTIATFAWTRQNSSSTAVIALNTTTNAGERVQINVLGATAGDPANASINDAASGTSVAQSSTSFVTNRWQHLAATYTSSTLRTLYMDGVSAATNTTAVTVDGLNQVVVGARKSTTYGGFYEGALSETCVWNVALSDAEILSLSVGSSPLIIRPANLKFYAPLNGKETSSEVNWVGSPVSLTNSPSASVYHPRIYRP